MSKITLFFAAAAVLSVWASASSVKSPALDVEDPYGGMMGGGKMGGGMMGGGKMGGGMMGGGMMGGGMMGGGMMGGGMMGGGMMGGGMMGGGKMGGGMMGGGKMGGGMMGGNNGGMMGGNNGGMMGNNGGSNSGGSNTVVAWHGKGVDVSAPCANWACLKQAGYSYAIVRIFQESSGGRVDPNGVASVKAAWAAGFTAVDVYMYPCGTATTTGVTQATAVLNALHGVKYGRIWIDVEGVGSSWSGTSANNAKLFTDIAHTLTSGGASVGVYTQGWQWNSIMGSSTAGSSYPVWYAEYGQGPGHYNTADGTCQYSGATQSLTSFTAFGGWTHAYSKQYNGDCTKCGCSFDVSYTP